ncbi:cysteine proteinase, partial [Trametes versicolor FP-101664 SS1]|uniref:cysteine proteinase n=1 Tax=Trametes versicolor (strain FP-101664) TaxID=717944 RepID=UPI0004621A4C
LSTPREWLSSSCIDGCSMLLQHLFPIPAQSVAIFSTFLPSLAFCPGANDDALWRLVQNSRYWEKTIWLFPIHHNNHWLLGIVRIPARVISVFDSFGGTSYCELWAKLHTLVVKLGKLARANNQNAPIADTGWEGYPATLSKLQTNSYDCGVWVVGCIVAVLDGHTTLYGEESQIAGFRYWLFLQASTLPTSRA